MPKRNLAEQVIVFLIALALSAGTVIINSAHIYDFGRLLDVEPRTLVLVALFLAVAFSVAVAVLFPAVLSSFSSVTFRPFNIGEIQIEQRVKAASDRLDSLTAAESFAEVHEPRSRITQTQRLNDFKPAWDIARLSLDQYWLSNIAQNRRIFFLSVAVITCGFVVMMIGVSHAFSVNTPDSAAVAATLGGVLTQFIGASFLLIYRATVRQSGAYVKTMERINSVGMAWYVLQPMPSENDEERKEQNMARRMLVEQIMNAQHVHDADLPS